MKNLITRAVTGAIFVAVIVSSIIFGPSSYIGVFSAITYLMLNEFYGLMKTHKGVTSNTLLPSIGGVVLFAGSALFMMGLIGVKIYIIYLAFLMITFIGGLYGQKPDPLKNWAFIFLGQVYIALPLSLLNILGFLHNGETTSYSPILVLSIFAFIWLNDTGAYLVGSMIGKRKLFERISPKKSWEGFFGGIAFSILAGIAFSYISDIMNIWQWMGMSAVTSIFATYGDLSESLLKRNIGIKDSGSILPGHGGFLDRLDSILLAAPAVIIYLSIIFL